MKVVVPTKQEVFNSLRAKGCCWVGGQGCQCYSRQLKDCYCAEEKHITKISYTDDEIKQMQLNNQKAMAEINRILDETFGD